MELKICLLSGRSWRVRGVKILSLLFISVFIACSQNGDETELRQRLSLNREWKFFKYESDSLADKLIYDVRPETNNGNVVKDADSKPTEAVDLQSEENVLKAWILPTANDFINDPDQKHKRPDGNSCGDFPFVQAGFDDSSWESINLPHDWAIKGPVSGRLEFGSGRWYGEAAG